jgi:O-succinylhomoserine sulfhydrylase
MSSMEESSQHFETIAVRTQSERSSHREHSTPVFLTSSFVFEDTEQARALFNDEIPGNIYTRFSNPNNNEFVEKICKMEGAEDGISTASGMSAIFTTFMGLLKQGDHVLASRSVFGSTHSMLSLLLPKFGITFDYADINNPAEWEAKIKSNTRIVYIETPSNPALDIIDMQWLGDICKKKNALFIVDNCFCTPYLQQPLKFGAVISIHSATKFIDGQGRTIGGVVVGNKDLIKDIRMFSRHSGPALSPFNAWILSKSLETLAVRMDRHCESALKLAEFLEGNPEIITVKYPHLKSHPQYELAKKQMSQGGGVVTFEVKGGLERGRKFLNELQMFSLTANLGDTRTTATHPASTTHCKLTEEDRLKVGITPGLVRISVGLEHIEDIKQDIIQALEKSKP